MQETNHRQHLAWTVCVSHIVLASLVCLPAPADDNTCTGAIKLRHTKAETDAIVEALASEEPDVVLATLEKAKGILRHDFKKGLGACLAHDDPRVSSAAFEFVLPCEIREEYPRLAKRLGRQFPGPIRNGGCITESETDLRGPFGPVITQFELLGEAAIPVLTEKLKAENAEHRIIAINLLGKTGSPEVVPALKHMLSDPDPAVRRWAVRALGNIGGKAALDSLYALRNEHDSQLVRAIAVALSQQQDDRALAIWQDLLKRDDGDYSAYGADGWICRFNHKKAIPILIDGIGHSQEYIRRDSLEVLKRLTRQDFGEDRGLWQKWWRASSEKEMYQILGEALRREKSSSALMAIVNEGDTRGIEFVLESYGKVRIGHDFGNERVDSSWALRILSGQNLPARTDHYGPPYEDDAGQIGLWRKWYNENKETMPRRSPLIAPHKPLREITRISIIPCAEHVALDGPLMFVGGRGDLEIFDISDVTDPERIGRYRVGEQGVDQIAATKGRLFLTTHAGSLHVYRYTPQGDIEYISTHNEVKHCAHFMVHGVRLLVCNHGYARAALYDISGDVAPTLLDSCDGIDLRPFSFSGEDGFFTTANWQGNSIVTTDCCPIRTVQKRVWPDGTALADEGRFYCIDHGLLVVRDLRTGKLLGTAPARAPYDARLAVRGGRAYAVLESMGIVVYDVSDPRNITVLSHTPLPGQPREIYRGLCVEKKYIFCANWGGDLFVFEVPEPLSAGPQPQEIPERAASVLARWSWPHWVALGVCSFLGFLCLLFVLSVITGGRRAELDGGD